MTEDERKAMEWLDEAIHRDAKWESVGDEMHRATLKAMLARPVMPEEPTPDALIAMADVWMNTNGMNCWSSIYRALYAHLTAPKTKEVEVVQWAVVTGHGDTISIHRTLANAEEALHRGVAIVRLTGKATVPA